MSTSPESTKWFFKVDDAKQGPLSAENLRAKIISGELPVETPVWSHGMETWAMARDVVALFPDGVVGLSSGHAQSPSRKSASKRLLAYGCAGLGVFLLVGQLFSRRGTDPYSYRRVSGQVLYEDGQMIPAKSLNLTFVPLMQPINARQHPRPGFASVDVKTGRFTSATSRVPGDGIAKGMHKVLISGENRLPLPEDVVPAEYANFSTTPLEADAESGTLLLKVKRPEAGKKPSEAKSSKAPNP